MIQAVGSPFSCNVSDSVFTNNTSGGLGGAIAVDGQSLSLDNVTLTNNTVRQS
jgi:predicted outer membrane repeat protein